MFGLFITMHSPVLIHINDSLLSLFCGFSAYSRTPSPYIYICRVLWAWSCNQRIVLTYTFRTSIFGLTFKSFLLKSVFVTAFSTKPLASYILTAIYAKKEKNYFSSLQGNILLFRRANNGILLHFIFIMLLALSFMFKIYKISSY